MRTSVIMAAVLAVSACAKDRVQIDMTYRVTVETLENDCDGDVAPSDRTVLIDVFTNGDGTMTLVSESGYVPGERYYPGLVVLEGEVNHRFILHAVGHEFHHDFDGKLTMDRMDLTLRVAKRKSGAGPFVECHEKVRLRGDARPLWDAGSLDGRYRVRLDDYGEVCPGEPLGTPSSWRAPMDVSPDAEGRAMIGFDESESNVFMDVEISPSGVIEWSGPMYGFYQGGFWGEYDAHVSGHVRAAHTDFLIEYRPYGVPGCPYVVGVSGAKTAPSYDAVDNAYRVQFTVTDDCGPVVNGIGPHEDVYDMRVEAVVQEDGRIHLLERPWRIPFTMEGNAFKDEFFYNWGEAIITYEGAFDPPYLDYVVDWHFWPEQAEYECHRRLEASGHVRFLAEGGDDGASASHALTVRPPELSVGATSGGWPHMRDARDGVQTKID